MRRIWIYNAAVFLSAFLLFQIQLMTAKALLPAFGGSYLVWGASMAFYQAVLLAGYLWAHSLQERFGVFRYARLHLVVLLLPMLVLPFDIAEVGFKGGTGPLALSVAWSLLKLAGLPALVLSTTSLILQRWLAKSDLPGRENPYVLYSASNLGSVLGLIAYPLLVEPFMDLESQALVWWAAYMLLVLLHLPLLPRSEGRVQEIMEAPLSIIKSMTGRWFVLSAAASALLVAATNVLTFDVASIPFLWILPLAAYLMAFVIAFQRHPPEGRLARAGLPWALLVGMLMQLLKLLHLGVPEWLSMVIQPGVTFWVCLSCALELIRLKPQREDQLTRYYLIIATGGLMGSVAVSWICPVLTNSFVEYPGALALAAAGVAWAMNAGPGAEGTEAAKASRFRWVALAWAGVAVVGLTLLPWLLVPFLGVRSESLMLVIMALPLALAIRGEAFRPAGLAVVAAAVAVALPWAESLGTGGHDVTRLRNYYGMYRIFDKGGLRYFQHGTTEHGRQYLSGPKRNMPQAYYHPSTPPAEYLSSMKDEPLRMGMIGLGPGALASYLGKGQSLTVFELDPDNIPLAETYFTYLAQAREAGAIIRYVVGDGRLSLQREPAHRYDILIVDAFNSGSIPVHLLTVEAFGDYMRVLKPQGQLLLHVSNRFLDLKPVVYANARELGLEVMEKSNEGCVDPDADTTCWMAVARNRGSLKRLVALSWWRRGITAELMPRPWTDSFSNLLGAMAR